MHFACFITVIHAPTLDWFPGFRPSPVLGGQVNNPNCRVVGRARCRRTIPADLFFQVPNDGFGAGAHLEPLKNIFDVAMHCPQADAHGLRDFLVHTTFA